MEKELKGFVIMFDLHEFQLIIEYLEQFHLDCEIEYHRLESHLGMLRIIDPSGDYRSEEEELEYHRKYCQQIKAFVIRVRHRYEAWQRFRESFVDGDLPF